MTSKYNGSIGLESTSNLKISAPITTKKEASELVKVGVSELYVWINLTYGDIERYGAKTKTGQGFHYPYDMRILAKQAHSLGVPLHLWLELPIYCERAFSALWNIAVEAIEAGIDGIITNDTGLMAQLIEFYPGVKVIASSSIQVANLQAVNFFAEMGLSRVILPSYLSPLELSNISDYGPKLEYGYNIYGTTNFYEEGFINTIDLADNYYQWELEWNNQFFSKDEKDLNYQQTQALRTNLRCFQEWISPPFPVGIPSAMNSKNPRRLNCHLCMLPHFLNKSQVMILQIGKGVLGISKRLELIRWLCANIDLTERGDDPACFKKRFKQLSHVSCDLIHRCLWEE